MRPVEIMAFEFDEYLRRIEACRAVMAERGIDVLLISAPDDMYWLTAYDSIGYYAFQLLLVPLEGEPVLLHQAVEHAIVRHKCIVEDARAWAHGDDFVAKAAEIAAEICGKPAPARIGYQADSYFLKIQHFVRLQELLAGHELVEASGALAELRLRKSPAEIEYVRDAGRLADLGMAAALSSVADGETENDLAAAIHAALYRAGSGYASSPFEISSGPHSAFLHGTATDRRLASGDPVTIELAGVAARYHVNILRTAVVGKAASIVKELHAVLEEAVTKAQDAVAPGVPVAEIDRITREVTKEYDQYRLHRTGYGLEAGYPPAWAGSLSISTSDPHVLEAGMVFSIEPTIALYDRDVGVILGNCVLVTEGGHEVLTATPLDLKVA